MILDYFQDLFNASRHAQDLGLVDEVETKVAEEMTSHLATPYRDGEEVVLALKQMQPNKALGLDGMAPIFF